MSDFDRRAVGKRNARSQVDLVMTLRGIREHNGITVAQVAEAMQVDPSMIYRFEKGGTNYTATTLRKYAKAVGAYIEHKAVDARDIPGRSITAIGSHTKDDQQRPWSWQHSSPPRTTVGA
ncbi:helix-turn-helix transcriptional regulator [Corynebacterium sp.]|uniref:helix-turn-helix domain-containing protein n=1 Tax=Corynebacterium sp. TaxID=1720 RepID=UPI0026DD1B4F|nr:helix-turn-helix transcriptional regulator [Corynebacterium sp.]MDO4610961.1 helix-turn-helix transcriptional regulator [Corynebacterium sp.]